uniref:C3H1-type domain-containing protein n=1 Tax=Alexandrium monilatum TaxID=311494 RepID=A0A7S4RTG7_9DINO
MRLKSPRLNNPTIWWHSIPFASLFEPPSVPMKGLPMNRNPTHGWLSGMDHSDSLDESSSSDPRLVYWLPSHSSSSGSRRRLASDGGRSSSGGEGLKRDQVLPTEHCRRARQAASSSSGCPPAAGGAPSSSATPSHARQQRGGASCAAVDPPSDAAPLDPEVAELLRQIPRDQCGNLTSLGSVAHEGGGCSPCQFWFKGVCAYGLACRQCHFLHEGQRPRRLRPSKHGRLRIKKRLQQEGGDEATGLPGHGPNELAAKLSAAAEASGLRVTSALPLREQQSSNKMSL